MAKADIDADLLKQAEELNILVTDEATAEAVQAAIDATLAEDAAAEAEKPKAKGKKAKEDAPKSYAYRINRDFWDEDGKRHRKGLIVEMTADEAQDGLESGALARVK